MSTMPSIQRPVKTKIVVTVGPACDTPEMLYALVRAGVDVFRINTAHGSNEDHRRLLAAVRSAGAQAGVPVAVLVDLAGPKIRLNELPGGAIELAPDEIVRFVRGENPTNPRDLTTTYAPLIDELSPGDRVMLADGMVMLTVLEKTSDAAVCQVVQGGLLRSRQGVNLPGVKLSVPALGEHDKANAVWAARAGADFISLSFVRLADDVRALKALIREIGSDAQVVAKIEKPEAIADLDRIVEAADAVMVARGDLGVEIDIAEVPVVQKRIIHACRRYYKPVIVATQMLDSMQRSRRPTRAEAADVANAILDGADACMLSGETAIGEYPIQSVQTMQRIAIATEALMQKQAQPERATDLAELALRIGYEAGYNAAVSAHASETDEPRPGLSPRHREGCEVHPITDATVECAGRLAERVGAKLIVVFTRSGETARRLSAGRHFVPTVGLSDSETVLRRMCLYWGVTPLAAAPGDDMEALLHYAITHAQQANAAWVPGDRIVLIGRSGHGPRRHNMIWVHEIE